MGIDAVSGAVDKMTAERMKNIRPFHVMELLARAKELESQGRSIIHMEVGEPDFTTPAPIIEAGRKALEDGYTHYTPALGIPELRSAISTQYMTRYGLVIDPARIAVTPGASGALQLLLSVLINPGDGVLMADPGYPCNRNFIHLVGGIPQNVQVNAKSCYQLNAELIAQNWRPNTRAVMVASPSNPTGTMLGRQELQDVLEVVRSNNGQLIVDEIYQGLIYGVDDHTALELGEDLYVINSFSKYYGMTGWRLGWLVAPEPMMGAIDRLAQNIFLSAPTPSQYAALKAFSPETITILEKRREMFQQRRDYLLPALRDLGFTFGVEPQGAFYLYGDCTSHSNDSSAFAQNLLEQKGVAVTPGKDFGEYAPESHIRFAYTTDLDKLQEGVNRIRQFVSQ